MRLGRGSRGGLHESEVHVHIRIGEQVQLSEAACALHHDLELRFFRSGSGESEDHPGAFEPHDDDLVGIVRSEGYGPREHRDVPEAWDGNGVTRACSHVFSFG